MADEQNKYLLENITNPKYYCVIGSCPAIYGLIDRTSDAQFCIIGSCPKIYEHTSSETYLIIGRKLDVDKIRSLGLESRIGPDETIVEIPKGIIDDKLE